MFEFFNILFIMQQ